MSGASKQRTRQERIDSLGIPKPRFVQWWQHSDKLDFSIRIGMALIACIAVLVLCQTWAPPFPYRTGSIPDRDLIARVYFEDTDVTATEALRLQERRGVETFYLNRPQPLTEMRALLKNQLFALIGAKEFEQLGDAEREYLNDFKHAQQEKQVAPEYRFSKIKSVFKEDPDLNQVTGALDILKLQVFKNGYMQGVTHSEDQGSQETIRVFNPGDSENAQYVLVESVQVAQLESDVLTYLEDQFRNRFSEGEVEDTVVQDVASMVASWIIQKMPDFQTLEYNEELSETARIEAANDVEPVLKKYYAGTPTKLADAGVPLSKEQIDLLRLEREALNARMSYSDRAARVVSYLGLLIALYLLCGSYIFFVDDRAILQDRVRLGKLLMLMVCTISLSYYAANDQYRVELIPLVMASIIAAVVYGRELGLLLMAVACISVTLFLGMGLSELVMVTAACATCCLLVGRIRTRTHLLYVGCVAGAITLSTVVGVGLVTGLTLSGAETASEVDVNFRGPHFGLVVQGLIGQSLWAGLCILGSCAAMTGVLSIVEKIFGVQTDLSLLELGDASHPLLRRLAQKAPGTYNHSINVASIAEAAAESIGAHGLLVRVGAYFHDIGKMFKPEYFIENQSTGVNQHDSLQPAMSTLVIIAHVKDGANLAENHHLPQPIIDLILQHHGTTLVEYFYREAARRSEEDPNAETVSDKDFRYPGPKPQTLEAAVMMLADTVESASRTLVDPTPARIQGLVDSIAQKKVADGQFDECGLTFKQLDRVRQSLVKSLTAIYHARVKYPGQQSA